jgi:hypothetical protein
MPDGPRTTIKNNETKVQDVKGNLAVARAHVAQANGDGIDVEKMSAIELATGNAVRFGSEVSSLSSIGDIADPVPHGRRDRCGNGLPGCCSMTDWEEIGRSQLTRTFLNLSQPG